MATTKNPPLSAEEKRQQHAARCKAYREKKKAQAVPSGTRGMNELEAEREEFAPKNQLTGGTETARIPHGPGIMEDAPREGLDWATATDPVTAEMGAAYGKATAPKAKKAKGAPKTPKQPKAKPAKKVSALTAAAQILAVHPAVAYTPAELIENMVEQGLWSSPGGKTPHATLSAAIIREITKKGPASRFRKVSPGHYAANKID